MRGARSPLAEASPVAEQGAGVGEGGGLGEGLGDDVVTGVVGLATVAAGLVDAAPVGAGGSLHAAAPTARSSAIRQVGTRAGRRMVRSTLTGVG
jgi:hypothetical protein